jgi:phospholipid-binding lipoprotein MlaA
MTARFRALLTAAICLSLLAGCATTTSNDPRDPFEPLNRGIYQFNEHLDGVIVKPIAELYTGVVPPIVRTGVSNFFSNINDVIVALNNLLQGKVDKALSDIGRIAVNSTAGLLGVFDVATPIGLEKHDEDFGQTLGYWGLGDGPYIVLPLFGPSSARDTLGRIGDYFADPVTYVDPTRDRTILWGSRVISRRAELLDSKKLLDTAALDPYEFLRDAYLQRRRNLVYDGNPPREKDDDRDAPAPAPAAKPRAESPRMLIYPLSADSSPMGSRPFSGEPLTPAQEEALEKMAAPTQARLPATSVAR